MSFKVVQVETPREKERRLKEAIEDLQKDGYVIYKAGEAPELPKEEQPTNNNTVTEARLLLSLLQASLTSGDELSLSVKKLAKHIDELLEKIK